MSGTNAVTSLSASRLAAIVSCEAYSLAIDTDHIDRLLLPDELTLAGDETPELPAIVRGAGRSYVGWDLGLLLGLPRCHDTWVVLRNAGVDIPVALRTGRCSGVRSLRRTFPVPRGIFRNRQGAFVLAFADEASKSLGLLVDPTKLLSAEERRQTEELGARFG